MVAFFYRSEEKIFWPQYETAYLMGLPIMKVALPPKYSPRCLERLAGRLYRSGIRRFLTLDPTLKAEPLVSVSPLPLLRAMGGPLALTLLSDLPLRQRRVAIRGELAGPEAWRIAEELCPQVGTLCLDFDRGEEELARRLRERYGAAALHLGQRSGPQAAVELEPRSDRLPQTLRLWGEPDLLGLTLQPEQPLPPDPPVLPFLELLWETGRVGLEDIQAVRGSEWP